MKLPAVRMSLLLLVFVIGGTAQEKPVDSEPVLQTSTTYSLPQSAVDAAIDGAVSVAVRVDETGKATNAALISGPMWPCGATPTKALEELSSTLSDTMMKLRFLPAMKNGKAVAKNVGLQLALKNPNLNTGPVAVDAATGKPKATQISGGVVNGKAKDLPKPDYPGPARANGDSGSVTIRILIDEGGKVIRAGGVEGPPMLQIAAREAACRAKFSPTTLAGNPVKVSGVLTYNFAP